MIKFALLIVSIICFHLTSYGATTSGCSATAKCGAGTATCTASGTFKFKCNPSNGAATATCWQNGECGAEGPALKCSTAGGFIWDGDSAIHEQTSTTYVCCSSTGSALAIGTPEELRRCAGY